MKSMKYINYSNFVENEIYDKEKYLPDMVFKPQYDCFFYFNDNIVRCSADLDDFAECLMNLVKEIKEKGLFLSYLRNTGSTTGFHLSADDSSQEYINAMNFEELPETLALNSPDVNDGVGIYGESKEWAIYSEGSREIAILGTYKSHSDSVERCFKHLLLSNEETKVEVKAAYHSSRFDQYNREIIQIFSNYPNCLNQFI
jgi:hypothetical protein